MHAHYDDLLALSVSPPLWFDENAVPRFCLFEPRRANIYSREVALLRVVCQSCGRPFDVCLSYRTPSTLEGEVLRHEIEYGDPPHVDCCRSGPTMMSVPQRVLQFWVRASPPAETWVRRPDLEIEIRSHD